MVFLGSFSYTIFVKFLLLILFSYLFFSCSKFSYIIKQGRSQLSLELDGQSVESYLADDSTLQKNKTKVKKIQEYKNFFYSYFNEKSTNIYNAVTKVPNDIVSYLVIASPKSKIEPIKHSFPIVGEFPYLGFFEKKDAKNFEKKMIEEGKSTYLRNVYAYSTLNQWIFDDNILTSFFHYEGKSLARLVFHELVHTVFFVSDEVGFNESLAQYVSEQLAFEYFRMKKSDIQKFKETKERQSKLNELIVSKTRELNALYKLNNNYKETLDTFLETNFLPTIRTFCKKTGITCWPLDERWNNARFAAFNTYEENVGFLELTQKKLNLNLKQFFTYLKKEYKTYKNLKKKDGFESYLKR